MWREGQVAPATDLVPIPVECQHVTDAAQDIADRAVSARITDAGVDPSPRFVAQKGDLLVSRSCNRPFRG